MDSPRLDLESRVFVAFVGEDLTIRAHLFQPSNQSQDTLTCSDPFHKEIYVCDVTSTEGTPEIQNLFLELKTLSASGEYHCKYKSATVYWFLRVRAEGYKEVVLFDYTEFIIVSVFTGVLLVFSVVGSVYVFRGHLKVTKCGRRGKAKPQEQEEKKQNETGGNNVEALTQSSSFYASLEPRTRSIYDVLDHSAADKQSDQKNSQPKQKGTKKEIKPSAEQPDEGVFECVYENF